MIAVYGLIILVIVLSLIVYRLNSGGREWIKKGVEYDKSDTLLRCFRDFCTKSFAEFFQIYYNQCPDARYHGVYVFLKPVLVIKDLDLIKTVLVKDFDHFSNRRQLVSPEVDPLWANSLFSAQGQKWHDLRSSLSPSFTGSKMRLIYTFVEEVAKNFVQHHIVKGESFELEFKEATSRFANDVIATAAFGLKVNSYKEPENKFFLMGQDATNFSGLRLARFLLAAGCPPLAKLLGIRLVPEHLYTYFSDIINDTVKQREEQKIVRPDMIHLMREAMKVHNAEQSDKHRITTDDLISQAYIFFIAGFDTVSSALGFVFYELALDPTIQERLTKEIDAVDPNELNYEVLQNMKYLNMVVSETLRKWPPGLVLERVVHKPYTIPPTRPGEKPLHLKPGDALMIPTIGVHRDPRNYPDPEKFDPERFNDENKNKIHPYANLSFGSGPRHCIGSRFATMELKLFIFHFLRNFQVHPVAKTMIPVVLKKNSNTMVPEGGMHLGIKRRN